MVDGRTDAADGDHPHPDPDGAGDPAASDAFQALGSETRTAIVRTLAAEAPRSFSALFEASDEDTSAGFAYHLRQLTGRFVRHREATGDYVLTDAGRAAARALAAGTYTDSVDRAPVELDDECPLCGVPELSAAVADNVTEVRCRGCETTLSRLSLPPGGYDARDAEDLPAAVDAHHRRRIDAFDDGVCPDCAGRVDAVVEHADHAPIEHAADAPDGAGPDGNHRPVRVAFDCETCGADLRCPVALTVLASAPVVAFYHDHGEEISDRPVWNVGSEWRERVVSTDPWCILVSTRLDDEELRLYVAGDGTVVDHRRVDVGGPDGAAGSAPEGEESLTGDGASA